MASESNSTPKLSLSKLPTKSGDPIHTLTPPIGTLASIPFQWEEAPGKPRATASSAVSTTTTTTATPPPKPKSARCLDLPPRLLQDATASPTTVLDGPYARRSLSTPSFNSSLWSSFNLKKKSKFGSWRWGSFKEDRKVLKTENFEFSGFGNDAFRKGTRLNITRVKRRSSFLGFSSTSSNLLVGIYESCKQAVPWKRRQEI